jgi:hypothetical protein
MNSIEWKMSYKLRQSRQNVYFKLEQSMLNAQCSAISENNLTISLIVWLLIAEIKYISNWLVLVMCLPNRVWQSTRTQTCRGSAAGWDELCVCAAVRLEWWKSLPRRRHPERAWTEDPTRRSPQTPRLPRSPCHSQFAYNMAVQHAGEN